MPDTVFISYSHDSTEHMEKVRALADRLRNEGVDCEIDQYEETPPEGWPRWMDRKVREATFVLVVCSEPYLKRFEGNEAPGKGLGARWEGGMIVNDLYESEGKNLKFIPIVFEFSDRNFTPRPLRDTTYYNLSKTAGYEQLYRRLTGQIEVKKPQLGKIRNCNIDRLEPLPEKEVKTSPSMLLVSPIDIALWDEAKWVTTIYGQKKGNIPVLGFGFKNEQAARKIFQGWHERYGDTDSAGELRLALIEGPITGGEGGSYTVLISSDIDVARERLISQGLISSGDSFLTVSRYYRMAGDNLAMTEFKAEYEEHQEYYLMPGVMNVAGNRVQLLNDLTLRMKKITFKRASELVYGELDSEILDHPNQQTTFITSRK